MSTYFVTVYYERKSQGTSGTTSINMELPDDWTVDYIIDELSGSFFCCELAIKEVKKVKEGKKLMKEHRMGNNKSIQWS